MLELRMIADGFAVMNPFDLPDMIGRKRAETELGDTIEALIAFMEALHGDADLEEIDAEDSFAPSPLALRFAGTGPGCAIGEPGGGNIVDEPHDSEEDACEARDDGCGPLWRRQNLHWGSQWDGEGA